ncbi:TPA: polyprenol monophosphomannose synthase [Candidatus Saccharibacteria bacterium]|nr:MAG: glycosyl transferase, dolichol-phosphate mannosyltransferase [Candidatus Saccharibacteria bacterium GW2011_GWC2_44_17]OGL33902.1 MAG: glycosyl transferase [Candidatus Saccharibacteria bacterium RIFCSPHIGHO2_12_FULL_47_16]HBH77205.1 polyprenol monophosphomannose synthase [Candidatus Saccharibacteria bacterium]
MVKVAIVTPTYNEIGNIENLLTNLQQVSDEHNDDNFSVFVIDDSSPDGTADMVTILQNRLKTANFSVHLIVRKEKNGLGKAYIHGFKQVLNHKSNFDFILQMDADLSHNPVYVTSFLHNAKAGADFIVASRYISGGSTPDWPWYRKLLSRGGNIYTRIFLNRKITDYTGGYNMYSSDLMRNINVDNITSGGYGFLIELKYKAILLAKKPAEVPIVFLDREHGNSKIPKSTILKNLVLVLKLRSSVKK